MDFDGQNEYEVESVEAPHPQRVRWGPVDNQPPGLLVEDDAFQTLIPWNDLKYEIEEMLLPQVRIWPLRVTAEVFDLDDRNDWIMRVVDQSGMYLGAIWFGPDPDAEWKWDGLVRVGEPRDHSTRPNNVWQTFERYSDGSYRLIEARRVK